MEARGIVSVTFGTSAMPYRISRSGNVCLERFFDIPRSGAFQFEGTPGLAAEQAHSSQPLSLEGEGGRGAAGEGESWSHPHPTLSLEGRGVAGGEHMRIVSCHEVPVCELSHDCECYG